MKVSVLGMPATLLNMSNNDIYKMVSGDKMDVKMNIFQRLWETLRHLFWSDKQPEAYKLLFNFVNNKAGNINASEYFTGAIDENEREKFINSLELFNKLKTCAKNPDEMVAKANMCWDTQIYGDIELSVTFLIENNEICTQTLKLCKGLGSLGVDLRNAYLPGVDMRNCYLGKKTIIDNNVLYLEPGWNANLEGAILEGAILDGTDAIIINKITTKKIATEEITTKQSTAEEITDNAIIE
ncbi:pentapeptide repeat-containing protein [Escherichia coli]|uniref:pentapeptide repeat-containing protein n=1 Tax=Escherichia coli TaxID=562 RepID=UPI0025A25056|nr:pentapeptide repeat-containing protein [Escherichia coli]MDM6880850.1 pentapeptide repeat-containing protein [Escherichia coli]WJV79622.1 pentapeptide repeat-containing protein [Escherichia coli]